MAESVKEDKPVTTTLRPHGDRPADASAVPIPKPPQRRVPKRGPQKGPYVKYVGDASDRIIRAAQWQTLDIPLKDERATHTWNKDNEKMIPVSAFTDEQLDYLLVDDKQVKGHHSFLEVDYDDEGVLRQV